MKKKLLFICIFLFAIKGYTQDSIVNYLDRKWKRTTKDLAINFEIFVKEGDSVWKHSRYDFNGKLRSLHYHKTKESKKKIGQSMIYARNGKVRSLWFNDSNGLKDGKFQTWFYNGNKNFVGRYIKNEKEGVWKYYHFNGMIASKLYYKKNKLLKSVVFDEAGQKISKELVENQKATFKGGMRKFNNKLRNLVHNLDYKIIGKVYVNFIIDTNGNIKNVEVENKLPNRLNNQIIAFFEKIKGWSPRVHMSRKYPMSYNIPLNFRK